MMVFVISVLVMSLVVVIWTFVATQWLAKKEIQDNELHQAHIVRIFHEHHLATSDGLEGPSEKDGTIYNQSFQGIPTALSPEMSRELLSQAHSSKSLDSESQKGGWVLMASVSLSLLFALLIYWFQGGMNQIRDASFAWQQRQESPFGQLIASLENTLKAQPQNTQLWFLLGRTQMTSGRPDLAVMAFKKAASLPDPPSDTLGQLAQALYASNQQQWSNEIGDLVEKALVQNPNEKVVLSLLGQAAYQNKNFDSAISHWQKLLDNLSDDDPSREQVKAAVKDAQAQSSKSSKPVQLSKE